jgi:TorA maturation chaperone TorD
VTVEAARVNVQRPLAPEESGRADFYALFARVLHAAPDTRLLSTLAMAGELSGESDPALAKAWSELVAASSAVDGDAAQWEFEELFIGVGKSEVTPYAGFYAGASAVDHPRVRLRTDLAALGLARREHSSEPEDHFAAIFDAMRILVAGGAGRSPATIQEQSRFYEAHVAPAVGKFFKALVASPKSNYYRKVAALGLAFFTIESESFTRT